MNGNNVVVGTYTGTGAAYQLELGFIPSYFKAVNITDGDAYMEWFQGMTAGHFIAFANHDTAQLAATTSNGVTEFEGEGPDTKLTGTVATTAGSGTITGTNSAFLTELKVGDVIKTNGGQELTISAIASATSATVSPVAASTESTNVTTRVTPKKAGLKLGTGLSESGKVFRYIAVRE